MHDLYPAARELSGVLGRIDDIDLDGRTPCGDWAVRDLLVHVLGLTAHFATVARHTGPRTEPPSLDGDWRGRLDEQLTDLADAWSAPDAWTGEGVAGGVRMPTAQLGMVALEELVLHGWDLARAVGAPFAVRDDDIVAVRGVVETLAGTGTAPAGGLYGPPVSSDRRSAWDRTLALAGRDPAWPGAGPE